MHIRRYKDFPKPPYFVGIRTVVALVSVAVVVITVAGVFFSGRDTGAVVSALCISKNCSKEILLKVVRCSLATITGGTYQKYITVGSFVVIIATIIVYAIAFVKARHSGNL